MAANDQPDLQWEAEAGNSGSEDIGNIGRLGLVSNPDPRAHAARFVDYRGGPETAAVEELIVRPVHRPAVIERRGRPTVLAQLGADPSVRRIVPHLQPLQLLS